MTAASPSETAAERQALLHKVLADPLRARILMVLGDREASPKELGEILNEDFQQVCYRVRTLKEKGFVELVDEDSKNGGVHGVPQTLKSSRVNRRAAIKP